MVTGALGGSAAGLALLKRLDRAQALKHEAAVMAHLMPWPRLKAAQLLSSLPSVTAMVDVRDGIARDLHRLVEQSGAGACLEESLVPRSSAAVEVASVIDSDSKAWTLFGGEDFELLFTVKKKAVDEVHRCLKREGVPATVIGEIRPKAFGVKIRNASGDLVPLLPRVWTHFARRSRMRR